MRAAEMVCEDYMATRISSATCAVVRSVPVRAQRELLRNQRPRMKCWEGSTCSPGSVGGSRKTPRLQISAVLCCCVRNTAYKIIILFLFPCYVPCCNPLKNDTWCDEPDRWNTCSKERPVLFSTALQVVFTHIKLHV